MGKRGPKPGTGGTPKKQIDFSELEKLCFFQATQDEIASWFDVDIDTINARVKEKYHITFSAYYEQKRGKGKMSLRRRQYQAAIGQDAKYDADRNKISDAIQPNTTMMIWLGKQYLGQADKQEVNSKLEVKETPIDPNKLDDETKAKIAQAYVQSIEEKKNNAI